MSEVYNAVGTVPFQTVAQQPGIAGEAIASSTNANPTVITTSSPHGFTTGDTVFIEGHLVNTNANGLYTITVLSGTTFSLNGRAGNDAGGATGYVVDYGVSPLITIPDDGDLAVASSVNPAFEGCFNLAPYFQKAAGRYKLLNSWQIMFPASTTAPGGTVGSALTVPHTAVWTDFTGFTSLMTLNGGTYTGPAPVAWPSQNDLIRVYFSAGYHLTLGAGSTNIIALAFSANVSGAGNQVITGTARDVPFNDSSATNYFGNISLDYIFDLSSGGPLVGASSFTQMFPNVLLPATYDFGLSVYGSGTATTSTIQLRSGYTFGVQHYRAV